MTLFDDAGHRRWGGGLLLLGAALLAYAPALRGGFVWDDYDWIVENPPLREPGGLGRIWLDPRAFHQYYPLTHTSFWLEFLAWGEQSAGYHLVNVGLHALAAFLLWRVLRGLALRGALVAAGIFLLHPVGVESVAWITERKNVLSMALALGSLLCWLPLLDAPEPRPLGADRRRYLASTALFGAAMLAKTAVCTLPALLLAGLLALTRDRAAIYVDQIILYRDTLSKNPGCAMIHANLGVALIASGQRAEGTLELRKAHRLDPADPVVAVDLATALAVGGHDAEAKPILEGVIARDPAQAVALNTLAGLLARSREPSVRDPARAVDLAERARAEGNERTISVLQHRLRVLGASAR